MRTNIQLDSDKKELPVENIYIGTLLAENDTFKFQSATVTGMKPNSIIREDHPDLFNNSYVVIRDLETPYGYPLSNFEIYCRTWQRAETGEGGVRRAGDQE